MPAEKQNPHRQASRRKLYPLSHCGRYPQRFSFPTSLPPVWHTSLIPSPIPFLYLVLLKKTGCHCSFAVRISHNNQPCISAFPARLRTGILFPLVHTDNTAAHSAAKDLRAANPFLPFFLCLFHMVSNCCYLVVLHLWSLRCNLPMQAKNLVSPVTSEEPLFRQMASW